MNKFEETKKHLEAIYELWNNGRTELGDKLFISCGIIDVQQKDFDSIPDEMNFRVQDINEKAYSVKDGSVNDNMGIHLSFMKR